MTAAPKTIHEPDLREERALTPQFKVLLHNDDVTPIDFVFGVLLQVFKLSRQKAWEVTLEAHHQGVALIVVEPREPAEFHVEQTHSLARGRKYPLTLSLEPA